MAAVPSRAEPPRWRAREGRRPHQDGPAGAPTPSGDGRYRHGCAGRRPSLKGEPPGTCQPENELPRRLSPEGKPPGVREAPSRPRALAWRVPDVVFRRSHQAHRDERGAKPGRMGSPGAGRGCPMHPLDFRHATRRFRLACARVAGLPVDLRCGCFAADGSAGSRRERSRFVAPADERIGPRCPGFGDAARGGADGTAEGRWRRGSEVTSGR